MLRRPATTLQITPEDIAAYEDRRANEALLAHQHQQRAAEAEAQAQTEAQTQRMEGVQESPGAARRARDERIGVGRRR
ncbi:hypothetical protein EsDP_00005274 [Epichloe bromicola]|uniref:Anaphase-promoting complex, subunit CDC26 n=1 Tax=Epichloe bromicola TaxID=79588 RepID=A0ABQ0CUA0_9HYPO